MDEIRRILDKQRQACHFLLKIDFGMLVGVASIFTFLKLERIEIFKTVLHGRIIFLSIIVLICYGLIFDWWTLAHWTKQEISIDRQKFVLFLSRLGISTQHILHIVLIMFVSGNIVGYSEGYSEGYLIASIQTGIEKFKIDREVFPRTIEDLLLRYPHISNNVRQLGKDKLQYTIDEKRGYVLRFAGYDGRLNTKDDLVRDHNSVIIEETQCD